MKRITKKVAKENLVHGRIYLIRFFAATGHKLHRAMFLESRYDGKPGGFVVRDGRIDLNKVDEIREFNPRMLTKR